MTVILRCERSEPRRMNGPDATRYGPSPFEALASLGHLRMTDQESRSQLPLVLLRLPRNRLALDFLEQHGGDQADDADRHDADEHHVDLQQLPRVPDEIADAALGGDEFGGDQH